MHRRRPVRAGLLWATLHLPSLWLGGLALREAPARSDCAAPPHSAPCSASHSPHRSLERNSVKTDKPENTKQATEKQATQPTFADAVTATAQQADTPPPVVVETAEEQQDWKKPDEEAETVREAQRRADDDARREAQRQRLIADYGLTDTEYKVLLATTCKDAPREIAGWFVLFCKHRRLDPFSKQVYLWNDKYEDRNTPNGPVKVPVGQWQVVTGIDGLRVIASRSPYYRGQLRPVWTY